MDAERGRRCTGVLVGVEEGDVGLEGDKGGRRCNVVVRKRMRRCTVVPEGDRVEDAVLS